MLCKLGNYFIRKFFNIKHNCFIMSRGASLKAQYGRNVLISRGTYVNNNVEIGDFSYVNENSSIVDVVIGKFCSISSNVYVSPFQHNHQLITTHPFLYNSFYRLASTPLVTFKDNKITKIGNDVWVGLNVVIMRGIVIGDGAVVAAGSILTKDVPPYEIWGGVPARFIKKRFNSEVIAALQKIKWWDWPIEKIRENAYLMSDVPEFILKFGKEKYD